MGAGCIERHRSRCDVHRRPRRNTGVATGADPHCRRRDADGADGRSGLVTAAAGWGEIRVRSPRGSDRDRGRVSLRVEGRAHSNGGRRPALPRGWGHTLGGGGLPVGSQLAALAPIVRRARSVVRNLCNRVVTRPSDRRDQRSTHVRGSDHARRSGPFSIGTSSSARTMG